jgi:hypothetical protein
MCQLVLCFRSYLTLFKIKNMMLTIAKYDDNYNHICTWCNVFM